MQKSVKSKTSENIPFVLKYSLKQRLDKFQKQKQKKPNFIPLIVQKHPKSKLPYIDKTRFICQKTNKFILVQKMIQNKVEKILEGESAKKKDGKASFFLYINNQMPNQDQEMEEIYKKFKAEDGFVYIQYGEMETFGGEQHEQDKEVEESEEKEKEGKHD